MIGAILVDIAFGASVCAVLGYILHWKNRSDRILRASRIFFVTAAAGIVAIAMLLVYLIMTHQFQYYYVWNYSSTDLPGPLLFSTFYAGQEGSFTLWALYTGIIGLFLMKYASNKGYETELMTIYAPIFSFLLLMLIAKNPFMYIWDMFPNDLLHTNPLPPDVQNYVWIDRAKGVWAQFPAEGKGLNPLLQNYWMVIHPPILFLGFTSMSIPYAHAVAGLLKRDYTGWIRSATPWTAFGTLALGTGIILGGYWAYETLGWGGYWGWDPVENSSLVPWLVCLASIHTMLSQRRNGSFIKTNFILSIFCFVLVLYSTFLTRSGVLGETSVHSFVDPGMWVYWLLLVVIFVFGIIGFGLFFIRWKEMPKFPVQHTMMSREFALFLGSSALVFVSIFVVIGTSSPIITNILKGKISAVDTSYYVTTTLPLGIAIALLIGIGQLLWWTNSKMENILQSLRIPVILASLFTLVTYFMGARQISMVIFIFSSSFALVTNFLVGYRIVRGNPKLAGGAVTHVGIALMFLGFVASSKYDDKRTVNLEEGKSVESMGYTMTYIGYHPIERGRYAFNVRVEKDGKQFVVAPVMYQSNSEGSLIRNPDIINLITNDFYLSPLSLESPDDSDQREIILLKNQPVTEEGMSLTYLGFDFSQSPETGNLVTVNVQVNREGKTEILHPTMMNKRGQVSYQPAKLSSSEISFTIKGMNPSRGDESKSSVTLSISSPSNQSAQKKNDILVVEASIKPYINLVWLGTFMMIAGFLLTIIRRAVEARR